MSNHQQDLIHNAYEATRRQGTSTNRHGTVEKVEEAGGERKALIVWGYAPDGTPCKVWSSSQEHRSGQQRSQDSVKPGQNVTLQGTDFRSATFTPQAEADHAPQPKHAPSINGPSQSIGKKLRTAYHGGQDDQQQSGSQGGSGGNGGGQSGGGQQQYPKEHYSASWIAEEDEQLPQYKPADGKPTTVTGSQDSMSPPQEQQQQQKEQKEEKRAMQVVMHEKEGHTAVIGKGDDAVRSSTHPKGAKIRAGSENFVVAEKDKGTYVAAKKDVYVSAGGKNYVSSPWVIKKGPKDPVPNHDLA